MKMDWLDRSLILLAVLVALSGASGQYPDTLWTRIHSISPSGDIDDGKCVKQTSDGGYIVTGACVPDGMVSHADVLLLKTDPFGHMQWVKSYGIEFMDEGLSLVQTFDGGYAIAGRALFVTGPNPMVDNQSDIWLLKTDANGDTLWTQTYGGSGHDYCTWLEQTPDSGYILAGTMNSGRSYPPTCFLEYTRSPEECAFLMKIDVEGGVVWTRTYGTGSYGNCVQQTTDGGYILAGMIVSNDQPDIYLVKTNSTGDTLWTKTIGRIDSLEFGRAIRILPDGYIIAGHAGPMPMAGVDGFLVRTDLSGAVLWRKSFGDSLSDVINAIEVTPEGGFFMVGNTNCMGHIHIGNMWVFSTDAQGTLLWQRTYDLALSDFAWSCTKTTDSAYAVSGLLGYVLGGDLWLAKIGTETGIDDHAQCPTEVLPINSLPNPFRNATKITFVVSQPGWISLKVYDAAGREIRTLMNEYKDSGRSTALFDAASLPSGTYFCRLCVDGNMVCTHPMLLLR